jgi:ankyrin repeat protein
VDINAIPPGSHVTGTALHTAAYQGSVKAITYLLDRGADTSVLDPRYQGTAQTPGA